MIEVAGIQKALQALSILKYTFKRAAQPMEKLLQSTIANAKNNFGLHLDRLYIKKALVGKGPTLKRMKPRARGRADVKRRRSSHITIILEEFENGTKG